MIGVKCSKCGKYKAVIDIKYMGKSFCENCFSSMYERRVLKTIKTNKMFTKKDKIGVGASGGKDSMVLLYLFNKWGYNIVAITVDEGIKGYKEKSISVVRKFCKRYKIQWHLFSIKKEYGFTLDQAVKKNPGQGCTFCGIFRRKLLNKKAKELKVDVLATAHNLDDEAQMILMNLFRKELPRLARGGPVVGVAKHSEFTPKVKPLYNCPERENVAYALIHKIPYEYSECPYLVDAYRHSLRYFLNELAEKYPDVKYSLVRSLGAMLPFLKEYYSKSSPNICTECGELAAKKICKGCETLKELKF